MEQVRCLLLDLDGTIYLGDQLIPGALRLKEAAERIGMDVFFLTNNSSRSREHYSKKITKMGWPVHVDSVLSSTQATALTLLERGWRRVYLVGTPSFRQELENYGITVAGDAEPSVDCVVVGFDTTLEYSKLRAAGRHILRGTPMISSNPDRVCPLEGGEFIPDCAAITACLLTAYPGTTTEYMGKPELPMLRLVESRTRWRGRAIAMVGDRLYTDVRFGSRWGLTAVLTLSGETAVEDLGPDDRPDVIVKDVGELADMLLEANGLKPL
ncbi:MAG: HAD-IIA family hydrolase [Firmicutes bacterium]|nr:HAD-IIA family hydrolase [Bacillota bacterium]